MKRSLLLIIVISAFFSLNISGQDKGWVLTSNDYDATYVGAPVANGTIGILPWKEPFSIRYTILNHIFDIRGNGVNVMMKGFNPLEVEMNVDGKKVQSGNISDWSQNINMREATHNTSFVADGKVKVEYQIVAMRNLPYVILMNIKLTGLKDSFVTLTNHTSVDLGEYRNPVYSLFSEQGIKYLETKAETPQGRYLAASSAFFLYDKDKCSIDVSTNNEQLGIDLKSGQETEVSVVASICTSHDFSDPCSEARRESTVVLVQGVKKAMEGHRRYWNDLWQGDIEIEGDDEAQEVVRFALYNLYSYCREGSNLSISPMGLSSQGYSGHIFWDSEIWMYPAMLMMNTGIAESMINYRCDRLEAAKRRAFVSGYKGAMYPWESDDFGEEATPTFALTGQFEHHITADIAIAAWNYYCVTHDTEWLRKEGWPMIREIADFWVSRVEENADGSYSINGVIGADEYTGIVNDNAFTNGSAIKALRCAVKAAKAVGEKAAPEWSMIADRIRILNGDDGVTSEYEGYKGQTIKQADVNLLDYPLGIITDKSQIVRNLEYYTAKTDKHNGPAMGFSIYCIEYARLGDAAKAEENFRLAYRPNMREPFGVLAESASSNNPYFATGAGGLLQAVINGFGGLDITDKGIVQRKSVLPPSWKKLVIKGVGKDKKTYTVTAH